MRHGSVPSPAMLVLGLGAVLLAGMTGDGDTAPAAERVIHATAAASAPSDPPRDARPSPAHAGMSCGECHLFFASDDEAAPATFGVAPPRGANRAMLRAEDPIDLCLRCHDGQPGIPDVIGDDVNGLVQRSAGHFSAPGMRNDRGHDLGRFAGTNDAGLCERCHSGSRAAARVTCTDCHDPHGRQTARHLRWPSDGPRTPPLGLFTNPAARGLARYEESNTAFGTLDGEGLREATSLCLDCHHGADGPAGAAPGPSGHDRRHPTYESERGARNSVGQGAARGTTSARHWEAGRGDGFDRVARLRTVTRGAADFAAARRVDAERNGVFCLTCHRAHGSSEPFALTWPVSTRALAGTGCRQCHTLGEPEALGPDLRAGAEAPGDR